MQCREFLARHPRLKVVEGEDTAGSAEIISREQLRGQAAICSKFAAPLYGMKVLEEGIETNKHNFTRFLVFSQPQRANLLRDIRQTNKASLVFTLPHEEGSLSQVLSILSFYKLNLTKIQSLPLVGKEWQYMFYVDLGFDDYTRYSQSIDAITPLTKELKILLPLYFRRTLPQCVGSQKRTECTKCRMFYSRSTGMGRKFQKPERSEWPRSSRSTRGCLLKKQ